MTTSDEYQVTSDTGGTKGQKTERWDLLPYDVLREVAKHYGKAVLSGKYEDRNWERGYGYMLSVAALGRHLSAWIEGEEQDEDGNHHLDAVLFHALALRAFRLRGVGYDDRPVWERPIAESIEVVPYAPPLTIGQAIVWQKGDVTYESI